MTLLQLALNHHNRNAMYGGTPVCPRCSKLVYQAEQTMGPGRKHYHKPCLACMSCNKRLDSYTLLEHDEQPYCKSCHLKLFGTRDLRHANLPQASPPASPTSPSLVNRSPLRHTPTNSGSFTGSFTGTNGMESRNPTTPPRTTPQPSFWARSVPAAGSSRPAGSAASLPPRAITQEQGMVRAPAWDDDEEGQAATMQHSFDSDMKSSELDEADEAHDELEVHDALTQAIAPPTPARADNRDFEREAAVASDRHEPSPVRTVPLSLSAARGIAYNHASPHPRVASPTSPSARLGSPISPSPRVESPSGTAAGSTPDAAGSVRDTSPVRVSFTGTRYGAALSPARTGTGGATTSPIRAHGTGTGATRWGGGETPLCARCNGKVYFAEQTKAVNKTFHKACLRCTDCGTSLDSRSLRDHEGVVFCARCYNKTYGPQGGGYALLGKAGG